MKEIAKELDKITKQISINNGYVDDVRIELNKINETLMLIAQILRNKWMKFFILLFLYWLDCMCLINGWTMIETIIYIVGLMLPSFVLGYCVKWMMDEEQIANEIASNKQLKKENEKLLKQINY